MSDLDDRRYCAVWRNDDCTPDASICTDEREQMLSEAASLRTALKAAEERAERLDAQVEDLLRCWSLKCPHEKRAEVAERRVKELEREENALRGAYGGVLRERDEARRERDAAWDAHNKAVEAGEEIERDAKAEAEQLGAERDRLDVLLTVHDRKRFAAYDRCAALEEALSKCINCHINAVGTDVLSAGSGPAWRQEVRREAFEEVAKVVETNIGNGWNFQSQQVIANILATAIRALSAPTQPTGAGGGECVCPNPALHLELAKASGKDRIDPKSCVRGPSGEKEGA